MNAGYIPEDIITDKKLFAVWEKVKAGIPASEDDLRCMLSTDDVMGLGAIAGYVRDRVNGKKGFYGVNMNLNYTNICELRCPLCAFSCDSSDPQAYIYSLEEIESRVKDEADRGIDEVHIVGGLHPDLKLDYFEDMLRRIKKIKKDMFIVAFTAVEYDYFAKINNISIEEVFRRLIDAGLGALPGGGAEIFAEEKRSVIAPKKISGKRWLEIMKIAHSFGLKTNATLLYNHIEDMDDIVHHLSELRSVQDQTGGFKTFVPLSYHDENTGIKAKKKSSTGFDDIRLYASARIYLHNIPHIKALWMYIGEKMAQVLLNFGVDDIGATYNYEKVVHSAGAATPDFGSEKFLRRLIESAGFEPERVTAAYEVKK
ncbi:MAG TPA: CofH family radical SAM protein [Spirochaetota bacterium]|nr:CofH family radical SAM protein [Spirochaetota bacterium]HPS87844.1 CofH family radical SAM protein [Spirochaetota bacterium]